MSTKRKVKFSATKSVKKFTKNEYEEENEEEEEEISVDNNNKFAKHTLDSDEEEEDRNEQKYKLLNQECLYDIGQEEKTKEFEGEIKLTAFNMKDELDDGNFDTDGFYHWKSKDKDHIKDAWLDNIEWANVNTFKNKPNDETSAAPLTEPTESDSETEETLSDEETNETNNPNEESIQKEIFKKMLTILKPKETVLKAIKRLGSLIKGTKEGLSASQRWTKKKQVNKKIDSDDDDQQQQVIQLENKKSLEALTGWANYFIDRGFYDVYEETYEKLMIKTTTCKSGKERLVDIFADDCVIEDNEGAGTSSGLLKNLIEDSIIKWVYKSENVETSETKGPFTSMQMLEMSERGDFKEAGVWCRKLEEITFYNSKRIDFDLYT